MLGPSPVQVLEWPRKLCWFFQKVFFLRSLSISCIGVDWVHRFDNPSVVYGIIRPTIGDSLKEITQCAIFWNVYSIFAGHIGAVYINPSRYIVQGHTSSAEHYSVKVPILEKLPICMIFFNTCKSNLPCKGKRVQRKMGIPITNTLEIPIFPLHDSNGQIIYIVKFHGIWSK